MAASAATDDAFSRSQYDWIMHCQGCHGAGGQGVPGVVPPLRGHVGRFLRTDRGRAYLARVPGVALVDLSDQRLAELLNWAVRFFDAADVPSAFIPYTGVEVGLLRRDALISNARAERRRILSGNR